MKNIIIIIAFTLLTAFTAWNWYLTPKIAFVRNALVVEKYEGTRAAKSKLEGLIKEWQSNTDSLKLSYNRNVALYNEQSPKLSKQENEKKIQLLQVQYNELQNYQATIEERVKNEEQKLVEGNLTQINQFVENYAKENKYDYVLGTTYSGNLMYAKDAHDITDIIIAGINKEYKTGK